MSLPRSYGKTVKSAVRELVTEAGGQARACAATGGRIQNHATMSRYGSPHEEQHMPVDVVALLEADVDAPIVTAQLADLQGYVLVAKPAAVAREVTVADMCGLVQEAGELFTDLASALADGTITAQECRDLGLRRTGLRVMEDLAQIMAGLEALEAE